MLSRSLRGVTFARVDHCNVLSFMVQKAINLPSRHGSLFKQLNAEAEIVNKLFLLNCVLLIKSVYYNRM